MNLTKYRFLFLTAVLVATVSSCLGSKEPIEYASAQNNKSTVNNNPARTRLQYLTQLSRLSPSLNLADASASNYIIALAGCASGNTGLATQNEVYLEVYEFDRDCLAKLTQFTLNGKTYKPKAGSTFTTWLVGDKATFEVVGASPADELQVEVLSTIANPVVAAGTVRYQFSEITAATNPEILGEADVRESADISIDGHAAPQFVIKQIELVDIDEDGNGEFKFYLECDGADVTGTGNDITCYDIRLDSLRLALVEDSYGGTLTAEDLQDIYTAVGGGVAIDMDNDAFEAGVVDPLLAAGGFETADAGDPNVMKIPVSAPMHLHPNMILVLKAGPSYHYTNIDVTTISQTGDH